MTIFNTFDGSKLTASPCILNYLSILAAEAARKFEEEGSPAMAKQARKFSMDIYETLEDTGYYST